MGNKQWAIGNKQKTQNKRHAVSIFFQLRITNYELR